MKYPNTGLFSFGKSLGKALTEQNKKQLDLNFYVHPKSIYLFDKRIKLVFLSKLHRIFFPGLSKFALVHFTDQYCRLRPQKVKGKKILTIHDINPVHEQHNSARKIEKHLRKLRGYIAGCDQIVAISHFVAGDILKYFPEAKGKVSVIYNGADKLQVAAHHVPDFLLNRPFLFTIGYVSAKKNFHVLPALLAGNNYELIISGIETAYTGKIMEEAEKFGVRHRVKITGPVSEADKAWYYKNCAAFVFPSIAEGFGLPVIEAMHFGKPVFLSTHTSLPEIGGDAAFYFESFDPALMQQIFADGMAAFDAKMQEKVIAHAKRFDWQQTAKTYLALYDELLKSAGNLL